MLSLLFLSHTVMLVTILINEISGLMHALDGPLPHTLEAVKSQLLVMIL